ncbi:MAG: maleylpyruvate isomerase family mycothiol-dependent enzyme [Actinomycetota bacterium]|nr:maleylpyruvate isomerase family mycothiol-dependent enzyme [Actinomycetota bacterium]
MSNATIYHDARERITQLAKTADPKTPVPTCPGWSVKDLVAHLSGSLDAYISDRLEGASSPAWGDGQVEERRDLSLEECLGEWERNASRADEMLESRLGAVAVADVLAHEQDIRTALHRPGHRDGEGILASVELALRFVEQKMQASNLPALRIVTEDLDRQIGGGEAAGTLNASTFELFRLLHGRRSPAQVRALDWDGDPETWIDVLFLFGPTAYDIHE